MRFCFAKYIENLKTLASINRLNMDNVDQMDDDQLIFYIQNHSYDINSIINQNRQIMNSDQFLINRSLDNLTIQEIDELYEFAKALWEDDYQLDLFLAYHIHLKILDWATIQEDIPLIIRSNYYCGLAMYYANQSYRQYELPGFEKSIEQHFKDASLPYLETLGKFDTSTRCYIIRSLANIKLAYVFSGDNYFHLIDKKDNLNKYLQVVDKTWDIFNGSDYKEKYNDLPWQQLSHSYNYSLLSLVKVLKENEDIDAVTKDKIKDIVTKARGYLLCKYATNELEEYGIAVKLQYYNIVIDFYLDKYDVDEFLLRLYNLFKNNLDNDKDSFFIKVQLRNYFINYWSMYSNDCKYDDIIEQMYQSTSNYYKGLTQELYYPTLIKNMNDTLELYQKLHSAKDINLQLLECFVQYDLATYIHSCMVSLISIYICQLIFDRNMDILQSCVDKYGGKEELLHFVRNAGVIHDIGKIGILNVIIYYGRPLFKQERSIIENHTLIGAYYLKDKQLNDLAQVCLGHHKYYDNSQGYPKKYNTFHSDIKPVIDVISIADSLDAASDSIGRNYNKSKSVKMILEEMIDKKGCQYNDAILQLFIDDESLIDQLSQYIETTRIKTYVECVRNYNENQLNDFITKFYAE